MKGRVCVGLCWYLKKCYYVLKVETTHYVSIIYWRDYAFRILGLKYILLSRAFIIPVSCLFCDISIGRDHDFLNLYVIGRKWKLISSSVLFSTLSVNIWEWKIIVIRVLVQGIIFSVILVYASQYGLNDTEKDSIYHN